MWRALFLNPLIVAGFAVIGVGICRGLGADPHLHEMLIAAGICLFSCELALVPVMLNDSLFQAGPALSALVGTVVHLMLATISAAVVLIWLRPPMPFVYWLLAMYWLTLTWLSVLFVKFVRQSVPPGHPNS